MSTTTHRFVECDFDREMLLRFLSNKAHPFTVSIMDGHHRTNEQNHLQRLWMNEISQQRGDITPEEARGYCKLAIGVPILRYQNEVFRLHYDRVIKPLPYETKLSIMMEPLDLPVTRLMNTKQKKEYLDGIIAHFSKQGIVLTMPPEKEIIHRKRA